jgi:hypothetical protein
MQGAAASATIPKMVPWKLPLIVAVITVPVAVAFAVAGPGVGVAVGALAAVALVLVASRQRPRGPISAAVAAGGRRHLLVVATCPLEGPAAVGEIAEAVHRGGEVADVLVLAPARIGFLDRWASDLEGARRRAQENLVATVAALAKAGVAAEARVGDQDVVQAVEDQLQSFPASEVLLISDGSDEADPTDAAASELARRLQPEFRRVVLGSVSG